MKLRRDAEGHLWVESMAVLCVDTLLRVPDWLRSDDPAVRDRLLPGGSSDPEADAAWRKFGTPEIARLFLSHREIILKDMKGIERQGKKGYRLRIAKGHENAWLAGLNAARHALFLLKKIDPSDLNRDIESIEDDSRREALIQLSILGWLQHEIIENG